jgi:hypothetical protein
MEVPLRQNQLSLSTKWLRRDGSSFLQMSTNTTICNLYRNCGLGIREEGTKRICIVPI